MSSLSSSSSSSSSSSALCPNPSLEEGKIQNMSKIDLYNYLQTVCQYDRLARLHARRRSRSATLERGIGNSTDLFPQFGAETPLFPPNISLSQDEIRGRSSTLISKPRKRRASSPLSGSRSPLSSDTHSSPGCRTHIVKKIKRTLNTYDPILLCDLPKDSRYLFNFTRPNGMTVVYNVESLIDYMLSTGDFREPETRICFADHDLEKIDAMRESLGLRKQSVVSAKNDTAKWADVKFKRDAITGLERCLGDTVVGLVRAIENPNPFSAETALVMRLFPEFEDYFSQLRAADAAYATMCADDYCDFIKGPPNNRTNDPHGLVKVVTSFIRRLVTIVTPHTQPNILSGE